MPMLLDARAPEDLEEERKIHKLAASPATLPATGSSVPAQSQRRLALIRRDRKKAPPPLQHRRHRWSRRYRPGAGRKPRLTEHQHSRIIALVSKDPPGRLLRYDGLPPETLDETKVAYRTLDALWPPKKRWAIEVSRSQLSGASSAERRCALAQDR
jgi:hypothetical protein